MNSVFVYCEIEDGQIAEVSQELLTKGKSLANELNCKLEAIAIGHKLDNIGKEIFHHYIRREIIVHSAIEKQTPVNPDGFKIKREGHGGPDG